MPLQELRVVVKGSSRPQIVRYDAVGGIGSGRGILPPMIAKAVILEQSETRERPSRADETDRRRMVASIVVIIMEELQLFGRGKGVWMKAQKRDKAFEIFTTLQTLVPTNVTIGVERFFNLMSH